MTSHTAFTRSVTLLAAMLLFQAPAAPIGAQEQPDPKPSEERVYRPAPAIRGVTSRDLPDRRVAVSLHPTVTVTGGTEEERERLDLALDRFTEARLPLPDLEVVFGPLGVACKGHHGLFQQGFSPWRISICKDVGFVYEHELAHAWEAATLTDEAREEYMALRGFTVWADHEVPWAERGVEDAVFVVQQALSGSPLPPRLSDEALSRLAAFDFLTDSPDPRLVEWDAAHGTAAGGGPALASSKV
ncbi:MAG: hypothetical protein ABFS21_13045 [Actinomycetota bacterium]